MICLSHFCPHCLLLCSLFAPLKPFPALSRALAFLQHAMCGPASWPLHWPCLPPRHSTAHPTPSRAQPGITFSPLAPSPLPQACLPFLLAPSLSKRLAVLSCCLLPCHWAATSRGQAFVSFGHCLAQCLELCLHMEYLQNECMVTSEEGMHAGYAALKRKCPLCGQITELVLKTSVQKMTTFMLRAEEKTEIGRACWLGARLYSPN